MEKALKDCDAFLLAEVTSVETVMAAAVESQQNYSWSISAGVNGS